MFTQWPPLPWLRRKAGAFSISMGHDNTGEGVAVTVMGGSILGVGLAASLGPAVPLVVSVMDVGVTSTSLDALSTSAEDTSGVLRFIRGTSPSGKLTVMVSVRELERLRSANKTGVVLNDASSQSKDTPVLILGIAGEE